MLQEAYLEGLGHTDPSLDYLQYNFFMLEATAVNVTNDTKRLFTTRDRHEISIANQGQEQVPVTEMRASHLRDIPNHYANLSVPKNTDNPDAKIGLMASFTPLVQIPRSLLHQVILHHGQSEPNNVTREICGVGCMKDGRPQTESFMVQANYSCSSTDQRNVLTPYEHLTHSLSVDDHSSRVDIQSTPNMFCVNARDVVIRPAQEMLLSHFQSLSNPLPPTDSKAGHELPHIVPYPYENVSQKRVHSDIQFDSIERARKRREAHNAIERRRRDLINDRISELSYLVPQCHEMLLQWNNPQGKNYHDLHSARCSSSTDISEHQCHIATAASNHTRLNKTFILEKSAEYIRQLQNILCRQAMLLKASNISDEVLDHAMATILPQCPNPYVDADNQRGALFYNRL